MWRRRWGVFPKGSDLITKPSSPLRNARLEYSATTDRNSNNKSLMRHIEEVMEGKVKDKDNYMQEAEGVCYVSTKNWSIEEVQEARGILMGKYHVMNCHTFKVMRLEPLDRTTFSAPQKMYPTPFDGFNTTKNTN